MRVSNAKFILKELKGTFYLNVYFYHTMLSKVDLYARARVCERNQSYK